MLLATLLLSPVLVWAQDEATPSVPAPEVASSTPVTGELSPEPASPTPQALVPISTSTSPASETPEPEPSETPEPPSLSPTSAPAAPTSRPTTTRPSARPTTPQPSVQAASTTPTAAPTQRSAGETTATPSATAGADQPTPPVATALIVNLTATPPAFGPWGNPVLLSVGEKNGWFPDVAVDQRGVVHVIWSAGRPRGQVDFDVLMYVRRDADTWSAPADVFSPGTGGFASRNSLIVTRDGNLSLLVRSQARVTLHKVDPLAPQIVSPSRWQPLQALNGNGNPYYVLLREDANGVLYAFWTETTVDKEPSSDDERCNYCAHVFISRSDDGGQHWTPRVDLTPPLHASARFQVALDRQGRLHAVWDDGKDSITGWGKPRSVIYRRSDDGLSWSMPYTFTLPLVQVEGKPYANAPLQSAVAVDHDGNPLIVFRSTLDTALLMARSPDGGASWLPTEAIPGITTRGLNDTPWDSYAMATDGAGLIHLLAVGHGVDLDPRGTPGLYHMVWKGSAWGAPELITHDARYPEWPRLTVAQGNRLHAVWFTRNADDIHRSDDAAYQIWYAERPISAPQATPLPVWTRTPSPTIAPSPTAAAPTLQPTLRPEALKAPPVTNFTSHELMALQIAGLALLPGLLILGLILALKWQRSRRRGPDNAS